MCVSVGNNDLPLAPDGQRWGEHGVTIKWVESHRAVGSLPFGSLEWFSALLPSSFALHPDHSIDFAILKYRSWHRNMLKHITNMIL